MELALAVAQPNVFQLKAGAAIALAATAVPPSLAQAAMLTPPSVSSTLSASQHPDPAASAVSTTVSASQLQALPASGRRWQEFLLDTPAANDTTESGQATYRGSQQSAEVTVDGASIGLAFSVSAGSGPHSSSATGEDSDRENATTQLGSRAWTGGHGLGVSEAAVREVTAAAGNVEAEGMRSAGGHTTIRTESGSNALHGQGFLFDRQNTWGARNPFTQWVTQTAPATFTFNPTGSVPVFTPEPYTPPDHETVLGLGAGSRIRRDKLFWFAALDSNHRNDPGLAMVKHPLDLCGNLNANGQCTYPAGFFETPTDCQLEALSARLGVAGGQSIGCVSGLVQGLTAYSTMLETLSGLLGPAPRMDDHADRCANGKCDAIDRAVGDVEILHLKRTDRADLARSDLVELCGGEQPMLFEFLAHQRQREFRTVDRHVQVAEDVGYCADMVLVRVREDDRAHHALVLLQVGDVRDYDVHSEEFLLGEHQAGVDHDDVVAGAKGQHVHAEFAQSAQRYGPQRRRRAQDYFYPRTSGNIVSQRDCGGCLDGHSIWELRRAESATVPK